MTTVEAVSPCWLWTCAFECGPAEPLGPGRRRNDGWGHRSESGMTRGVRSCPAMFVRNGRGFCLCDGGRGRIIRDGWGAG